MIGKTCRASQLSFDIEVRDKQFDLLVNTNKEGKKYGGEGFWADYQGQGRATRISRRHNASAKGCSSGSG